MKTRHYHYARKFRQLQNLARQVEQPGESNPQLLRKLKNLYERLRPVVAGYRLRKALAGVAIALGLGFGPQIQAQNPVFAPPIQNPFSFQPQGFFEITRFVDIDNDGDLDIFSSGYDESGGNGEWIFRFYENIGSPNAAQYAEPVEGSTLGINLPDILSSAFADMDNDGDQDLLVNYVPYNGELAYYENIGDAENPVWGAPVLNPFGLSSPYYFAFQDLVDMDNDGDFDLMSSEYYGMVNFYENIGTPEVPNFAPAVADPFGLVNPLPFAIARLNDFVDFDGDGDPDVFQNAYDYGYSGQPTFYYIENTGTPEAPAYAEPLSNPFGIETSNIYAFIPTVVDIDDDGDLDLFVSYYENGGLFFYENLGLNSLPSSADAELVMDENTSYTFDGSEFVISDDDGDELAGIRITSLPALGSLTLDGAAVAVNQEIPAADLPLLAFTPAPDEFGDNYAGFQFQVFDGIQYSLLSNTITFDVLDVSATGETVLDVTLRMTPNPVIDVLHLQLDFAEAAQLQISMRTVSGTHVRHWNFDTTNRQWSIDLPATDLAPGLYLLEVQANGKRRTEKFVKK